MKKKLIVTFEIGTEGYEEFMEDEGLTFEEAVGQLMDDGDLEFDMLPVATWRIE